MPCSKHEKLGAPAGAHQTLAPPISATLYCPTWRLPTGFPTRFQQAFHVCQASFETLGEATMVPQLHTWNSSLAWMPRTSTQELHMGLFDSRPFSTCSDSSNWLASVHTNLSSKCFSNHAFIDCSLVPPWLDWEFFKSLSLVLSFTINLTKSRQQWPHSNKNLGCSEVSFTQ